VSLRWRSILVGGVSLVLLWVALANFVDPARRAGSALLPVAGLRLGLDLRGGIHWVLGPRLEAAVEKELEHLRAVVAGQLEEKEIVPARLAVDAAAGRLLIEAGSDEDLAVVRTLVGEIEVFQVAEVSGRSLALALTPEWQREVRETGMLQALEVLRRRIDDPATGIPESVVTRQGQDRILVQIPGVDEVPKDILDTTGFLEFKIVLDTAPSEELLRARHPDGLPPETEVLLERDRETERVIGAYLVPAAAALTGDYLDDARPNFDQRRQRWIVEFTWKSEGGRIFGELSEKNVGKQLAIVLDDEVYSAPVIQERIGMRGQISGRFSSKQAADLSVILRAGSLPIPVVIEEERNIGPALGADSIRRGTWASLLGFGLVMLFAVVYYRFSGVYAALVLLLNAILIVALMSLTGATLTLPGIAGIVLTVGMAVDANVIIYERIREELRLGKTPRGAIAAGFSRSVWTVLDANITTLIAAIILFEYGTGPIKGFAVTLSIGIVTTLFCAVVVTRLLFDLYPGARSVPTLSI
jgi:preprotein translocase subunit SecD